MTRLPFRSLHLGWVQDKAGGYRGQMAVYVKPNGLLGTAYVAAIRPFRHLIVYPQMMRKIEREWRAVGGVFCPGGSGVLRGELPVEQR